MHEYITCSTHDVYLTMIQFVKLFLPVDSASYFDLFQMAYTAAQCSLSSLHNQWKRSLECTPEDESTTAFRQLEIAVCTYIRKVAPSHETHRIVNVCNLYQ